MPRPPTRPVSIPRAASDRRASTSIPTPSAIRPSRPELPPPVQDEEMTMMMASKSASALPPPPDPHAARIPRQWSPIDQHVPANVNAYGHHAAAPTMPSLNVSAQLGYPRQAHSSVPAAPSSLVGLSVSASDTTARVRTGNAGALGNLARPTLSWAAALVALGIFVGVGSAVVSRNDSVRAKVGLAPSEKSDKAEKGEKTAEKSEKADKADKTDKLAKAAPRLGAAPPPLGISAPVASAKFATPPPPLTPIVPPSTETGVVPSTPVARPDDPMADIAALAAAVSPPKPKAFAPSSPAPRPRAARSTAALGPEARDALELAKSKAEAKSEAKAEAAAKSEPAAAAPAAASSPAPAPASAKGAKQKEIDLSKQAADLAAEQMKSLL